MQTVLQELISELKSIESYDSIVQGIIKRAESKLEKEKQQIIDAYYGNIDGVYGYREAGEEYYNQTYNL
jgi:predicted kinase